MKKRFFKNLMIAIALFSAIGCNKNNPEEENNQSQNTFNVKSAKITYEKVFMGNTEIKYDLWDNYGKLYRTGDDKGATIVIEENEKGWVLTHSDKTYTILEPSAVSLILSGRSGGVFIDKPSQPNYKKLPNRTIAGKNCDVYSFEIGGLTTTLAGWNGIVFSKEEKGIVNGIHVDMSFTALDYSETIPDNSFKVPSDYALAQ